MTNIFEVAIRNKFRFNFKGMVTVEDLWDLTLTQLDSIYKTLNKEIKETEEDSLLGTKTKENDELQTKIEIIKYIVQQKVQEKEDHENQIKLKQQKQQILGLLEKKQQTNMENMSEDQLLEMLNNLK